MVETSGETDQSRPWWAYLILLSLVLAAAFAPIFIRKTQEAGAPSLYIIATRLIITSLVLTPVALGRHSAAVKKIAPKTWFLIGAAGVFLSVYMVMLFVSLEFTSVLVASVMRRTTPLWVIWLEIAFLGAVFTRNVWLGLFLTFIGSLLVGLGAGGAIEAGSNPLLGGVLALIGAISMGPYLLIGRRLNQAMPSLVYSWLVFSGVAVLMVGAVLVTGTPVSGYSLTVYIWILVGTLNSYFLGYIPMNYSLRYFRATYVSLALQVAVLVSGVVAVIAFQEIPSLLQIAGSVAILGGITFVSFQRERKKQSTFQ